MKYCKKCLQPDTRPAIYFDAYQVCGACLYEESKVTIDWNVRSHELEEISEWAKKEARDRKVPYHCTIGVSGGKDSTFQAIYAKEKLGLHPLLVNCVPDDITEIGRNNLDNLASFGFDVIQIKPNPKVAKHLAKRGFYEFGNIVRASEYCLYASSFRVAYQYNIPLNIVGENPALTLGVSTVMDTGSDALGVFDNNTQQGGEIDIWVDDIVSRDELYPYSHPNRKELDAINIRAIYLQYFLKEWSQVGNADFAVARGLLGRNTESLYDLGRYRRYTALDADAHLVNQMIKYLKFGFGFATDEACYDIREGRLSREDAIWYVVEYDGKCGQQYIKQVCDYLEIDEAEFWRVADMYVNKNLFQRGTGKDRWIPKFTVGVDYEG